jgi:osmotically inducible protein OsmC
VKTPGIKEERKPAMITRNGHATWEGNLKNGHGSLKTGSDRCNEDYSYSSRFESGKGTNPEELIGAAHAGCFSMALSQNLTGAGHEPKRIDTRAAVKMEQTDDGPRIAKIVLDTEATVPDMGEEEFKKLAEGARKNCIVSRALGGTEIELNATLKNG